MYSRFLYLFRNVFKIKSPPRREHTVSALRRSAVNFVREINAICCDNYERPINGLCGKKLALNVRVGGV